jgi:hypothetical protein
MTVIKKKKPVPRCTPASVGNQLAALNAIARRWFYQPDLQAIRVTLGTMKAHSLKIGDPAWLIVVAPPGIGKTTLAIMGAAGLPEVVLLGGFTAKDLPQWFPRPT